MTPEEIQAHAANVQDNNYGVPASIAAPVDTPAASAAPQAPVAQSNVPVDMPQQAPVQDGSQQPIPITQAVPGQRVQTASAFNVGQPEITPHDITEASDQMGEARMKQVDAAAKEQKDAIEAQGKIDAQVAEAQAPIEDLRQRELAQQVADQEDAEAEAQENARKHMAVIEGYNKEIQDHIANQPTDLWGRAGVNKIAGIIGLALGGLGGGATGGKNLVVDTLNNLVEQNLKQNEYKYSMLKGKVDDENTAYAQIRATAKDAQEAADRYRLISLEQYKQQLQQAAQQFAGPKAKANAQQMMAQIDAQSLSLKDKIAGDTMENYRAAANAALTLRQQNLESVQLQAAEKAAKDKENDAQYLPGAILPENKHVPASEVEKLRQAQGGAGQVQDVMDQMIELAKVGGVEAVIANKSLQSDLKQALIKQRQLSNRVSKDEGALLDQSIGFLNAGTPAAFRMLFGDKNLVEGLMQRKAGYAQSWVTNLTQGYGYQMTPDNPFVAAMKGQSSITPSSNDAGGSGARGADPIAALKSRAQLAKEAVARQQLQMRPAGYGAM